MLTLACSVTVQGDAVAVVAPAGPVPEPRLQAGLAELDTGRQVTGNVDPERLSSLERDLLKDALAVVKRFKALLHQRLRLDLL